MIEKRVRARWAVDAVLLAEVGRQLESQKFEMSVTLPRKLVLQAIAKWSRDDAMFKLRRETKRQKRIRHRAGSIGVIGLHLSEQRTGKGKLVTVKLPAHLIGDALNAHWDNNPQVASKKST